MPSLIPTHRIASGKLDDKTCVTPLLPDTIPGAVARCLDLAPSDSMRLLPGDGNLRILIAISGRGEFLVNGQAHRVNEIATLLAAPGQTVEINAGAGARFAALDILWRLTPDEIRSLAGFVPYFKTYSDCKTYKEAIKSPKTVNRTLVSETLVPRFCMGSVETAGPDVVARHRHPMLEQYFFGLSRNDCRVSADDSETAFGEMTLLKIPSGAEHGVIVDEGKTLHYLWLDFFSDPDGMRWITQMHTEDK